MGDRGQAPRWQDERRTGGYVDQFEPVTKMQRLWISLDHLDALQTLPFHPHHRDPFDHLIIAQAIAEGMTLVTADGRASLYPVQVMTP